MGRFPDRPVLTYSKAVDGMSKGHIGILTTYHLHEDGTRIIYGGAERYGIELTKMLLEEGYRVSWWQIGSGWEKEIIPGVPLYSIPLKEAAYQTCPSLNQAFFELAEKIDFAVYFSTLLAYPQAFPKSISISHGVYWDYPTWEMAVPSERHRREWLYRFWSALNRPAAIVSCDTATVRFANTSWPGLAGKFEFIPNFVDTSQFYPASIEGKRETARVLFPRRLTAVRGLNETVAVIEKLAGKYPHLEFHLAGRGHSDSHERNMLKWAARNEQVYYYWRPPHEMPRIYRQADIVLIPTKAAEGTSLSCLEAMASGKAVIAGCTGGLSDLIIDGYNGILLRPLTVRTLHDSLELLINEPELRKSLGEKAHAAAQAFSLDIWKKRWQKLLGRVFV